MRTPSKDQQRTLDSESKFCTSKYVLPRRSHIAAPNRRNLRGRVVLGALALLGAASLAACQQDRPQRPTMAEEGRELFGTGSGRTASSSSASREGQSAGGWSIVIVAFRGPSQDADAQAGLARVRSVGNLPDAYLEKRGETTVIALGRYAGPDDPRAQADLERVRAVEAEGQRPFAAAVLAPPAGAAAPGAFPEYDLRNAKRLNGDWALYTLQVGVYSREGGGPAKPEELAEFRKAAEAAVVQLRHEGHQAFYYHGPNRSMVTVGLFGKDDFDPQVPGISSPALRRMREAFPHNLLNGRGIRERIPGRPRNDPDAWRLQPSALVAVPKG